MASTRASSGVRSSDQVTFSRALSQLSLTASFTYPHKSQPKYTDIPRINHIIAKDGDVDRYWGYGFSQGSTRITDTGGCYTPMLVVASVP